ncbi:hypothetical protein S245_061324 [Arachis hypogaea]
MNVPFIAIGDYNEVLTSNERCSEIGMIDFKIWMEEMNLVDLPLQGKMFTWRRGSQASILDKICVDPVWIQKFPHSKLEVVQCSKSDHVLLWLKPDSIDWNPCFFGL